MKNVNHKLFSVIFTALGVRIRFLRRPPIRGTVTRIMRDKRSEGVWIGVMLRLARAVAVGCARHITPRGTNRQDVFFVDDDWRVCLELLAEQADKYGLVKAGARPTRCAERTMSRFPWHDCDASGSYIVTAFCDSGATRASPLRPGCSHSRGCGNPAEIRGHRTE